MRSTSTARSVLTRFVAVASETFRTAGFDLGPSLVGSLDNVQEVLSRAEGA